MSHDERGSNTPDEPFQLLWTLTRGSQSRRCQLRCDPWGCELQLFENNNVLVARRFKTRREATAVGDAERLALMRKGWWPVGEPFEAKSEGMPVGAPLDPEFDCPQCDTPLVLVRTAGMEPHVTRVYECKFHGEWVLEPGSDLRLVGRS
jgi:hypothetical protein